MRPLQVLIGVLCLLLTASARADDFEVQRDRVSTGQARLLSVLYSGVGQLATGHRERGTAMVVGQTVFLVAWLTANSDYGTHKDQFKRESERYLGLRQGGSFAEAEQAWGRLQDRQDDLDRTQTVRVTFAVLSAALYAYNLADVFLLDGTKPQGPGVALAPRLIGGEAPGLALVGRWR